MSLSDFPFFVLGLILAAWDWLMHKFADLSTWGREPLSGGWALAGLVFIWTMHTKTREKVATLSKQVEGLRNQLARLEHRLGRDR